jgi:competence protein ComEA
MKAAASRKTATLKRRKCMTRTLVLSLLLFFLAPHSHLPAAEAAESGGRTTSGDTMSIMLDLNTATYDELLSVRGIGPALAARILAYRTDRGSFSRIEELLEVEGIGAKSLSLLRKYFTLPPPPSPEAKSSTPPR